MANWYYYDIFNQKQGPVDSSELKRLVSVGIITAETEVETEDGKKSVAKKIKGLGLPDTPTPSPSPSADNIYNFSDIYPAASDNTTNSVPVPPFASPSPENQSAHYSSPSYSPTSYSRSQSTTRSTRRVQESEEESSVWDYVLLNPKFTIFVTSYIISFLWRVSVIIFIISIFFSVFMMGNGCRILSTLPSAEQLEKKKENPPKEIKDLITKKSNLLKENEKIEKQKENIVKEIDGMLKQMETLLKEKENIKKLTGKDNDDIDRKIISLGDQLNNKNDLLNNINSNIDKQIKNIDDEISAFKRQIDLEISKLKESNAKLETKAKKTLYEGFRSLIVAPFCLLLIRLSFELIFVFFRIENHLKQIEEKT